MRITKRDGSVQQFDRSKILKAMRAPFGGSVPDLSSVSRDIVVEDLDNVELIQDRIEKVLMQHWPEEAKQFILYREQRSKMRELHPDPRAMQDYIHYSKYSRGGADFETTVERVQAMHIAKFPDLLAEIVGAFEFVHRREVLPSMRSMQFAGKPIKDHNARMYNCSFTHVAREEVFGEIFYLLLCGCGVGYSVQFHHVEKLPTIKKVGSIYHWVIKDTIEGWAEAVRVLMQSYFQGGCYMEFSYNIIRPEGSPLSSGGKAPGHLPLKRLLEKLRRKLDEIVGRRMRPIEVHDIICHIAEAVLSGGIRRSSLIALFSPDDGEMMYCKTRDKFETHRAMANNSAVFLRGCEEKQWRRVMALNKECHGEPGFFMTDDLELGTNPCGEILLEPSGGFAFCNLTEINGSNCNGTEFLQRVRSATIIGTLQASYTGFRYLQDESKQVAERDALLGVSITGIADNVIVCCDPALLHEGRILAVEVNAEFAVRCGINSAKRITTVKPAGTSSLVLGCSSGIHSPFAKRYLRRVTANPNEPVAQELKKVNPQMVETKPNGDLSITFCMESSGDKVSPIEFLKRVKLVKEHWCDHNVSATVVYTDFDEVIDWVWRNIDCFQSLTFLEEFSWVPFMPLEVSDRWRHLVENYVPVDYKEGAYGWGSECEGQKCEI